VVFGVVGKSPVKSGVYAGGGWKFRAGIDVAISWSDRIAEREANHGKGNKPGMDDQK
jgi:hypothetical protein